MPGFARRLLDWHVANTGDPLMNHVAPGRPPFPAWFRALVLGELLLQVPFFFVAIYAFVRRRKWIRLPALAYGVHTATTLLPILLELAESPEVPSPAARVQVRRCATAGNCALSDFRRSLSSCCSMLRTCCCRSSALSGWLLVPSPLVRASSSLVEQAWVALEPLYSMPTNSGLGDGSRC